MNLRVAPQRASRKGSESIRRFREAFIFGRPGQAERSFSLWVVRHVSIHDDDVRTARALQPMDVRRAQPELPRTRRQHDHILAVDALELLRNLSGGGRRRVMTPAETVAMTLHAVRTLSVPSGELSSMMTISKSIELRVWRVEARGLMNNVAEKARAQVHGSRLEIKTCSAARSR